MITFIIGILALVLGYAIYGKWVAHVFGPDDRKTPAIAMADGIDYVAMPTWKVYMIQFLNIAGTGPIFGAIMGMWFGPASYLWIILGCIFGGAVHDYLSGMLSMRNGGAGLPTLIGKYLGNGTRVVMLIFTVLLLVMVGAVFVYSPAIILDGFGLRIDIDFLFIHIHFCFDLIVWMVIIFIYYIIATLLPIDKIIGKIYPLFAASLIFMAVALMVVLFIKMPNLPELWDMGNMDAWRDGMVAGSPEAGGIGDFMEKNPIFPCLFITIACGAISGFHATQSPLMARCLKSEKLGRRVFYGSMITEGVVALVWATVSSYFFYYGGWREFVDPEFMSQLGDGSNTTLVDYFKAPMVVKLMCTGWLGVVGGVLAILGVVAAPITSGDTAFRSVRLIIAETLHIGQRKISKRLMISVPLFVAAFALIVWQAENPKSFNVLWQYFGWSNQTLSVFTLWMLTVFLVRSKKAFGITLVPALLMTVVCGVFLVVSPLALGADPDIAGYVAAGIAVVALTWFLLWYFLRGRKSSDKAISK